MVELIEESETMLKKSNYLLIIEDSKAETHLLLQTLKMYEFPAEVQVLHSGAEVISLLNDLDKEVPGLILLDLRLPDIDGLELLHVIKGNPRASHVEVVIRTGSNDPRDKAECLELGALDFMVKSMEFESVEKQVISLKKYWNNAHN